MCGISGIFHENMLPLSREKLVTFNDSMRHRGPDGSGIYLDPKIPFGMGHRRLSILDLSDRAAQPMPSADSRYWIAYNGEVFNFLEIRSELEKNNYSFRTDSDTEVVIAAYHLWGEKCLAKFNGMWGFSIWDSERQELFLARDRFGVKPLYYLHIPGVIFAFASETYAFRHLDDYKREWNESHLALNIQNPFALEGVGHTIIKHIYQVLPGHFLKISAACVKPKQKRWWDTLENRPKIPDLYEAQIEEFFRIFQDSTLLRLRSDVKIATALSGGVDSSAIYCMLMAIARNPQLAKRRFPNDWQQAFVATFPDTSIDEKKYADEVLQFTGGKANYITPNYNNLVDDIVSKTLFFDSVYLTPISIVSDIYAAMRQHGNKISLDGHGVDEMLLGYPHFSETAYLEAVQNNKTDLANDYWETYKALFPSETQISLKKPSPNIGWKIRVRKFLPKPVYRILQKLRSVAKGNSKRPSWMLVNGDPALPRLSDRPIDIRRFSDTDRLLYQAFHVDILPTILRNFDRASMQNSIEIRMPFMDFRLVSFVFALPLESKIGGGFTKRILRDAMRGMMPESIRSRKLKIGLNAPLVEWFNGPLARFILDEVNSQAFRNSNIWNGKLLATVAEEKVKNQNWTWAEASNFWTILNAHILLKNR